MQDSLATVERFEVSGERLTLHSEGGQALDVVAACQVSSRPTAARPAGAPGSPTETA